MDVDIAGGDGLQGVVPVLDAGDEDADDGEQATQVVLESPSEARMIC